MGVNFPKKFVNALNYLRQFSLSHGFPGKSTWTLLVRFDDFHVLFFLLSCSFQGGFHVFLLFKFLKSFNADDGLVGEPYFLASVCKQQRRISLILIVL